MFLARRIGVVVPAFNTSEHIEEVLKSIPEYVDNILFVNDGSTDETEEIARKVKREGLVFLSHPQRRGVGAAMETGYRAGIDYGCEILAVMAGDGQMDPDDLESLLVPIVMDQADYVKGNRFLSPEFLKLMPVARQLGNVTLSLLSKPVTGYWDVFDSQCGYTAISAETLCRILEKGIYHGYGVPNDLLVRLKMLGARVAERPVKVRYSNGSSRMNMRIVPFSISLLLARLWLKRVSHNVKSISALQNNL